MSLRPDDQSRRSRSKSPGHRGRERSRSNAREPQQYGAADTAAAAPQYEFRQPGQQYATQPVEPITMGNYSDLPPNERPGYTPQASFAHPATTAYTQTSNPQYAPSAPQYGYTTQPVHSGLTRTPAQSKDGFQYATAPSNITYTAKPVGGSTAQPPAVRHNPQPSTPSYPYTSHAQSQYTPLPHAPPPPQTVQPAYPPPPPLGNQSPHPEHQRASSYPGPTSTTQDGRKVVEMVPGGGMGGERMNAPPSPGLHPDGRHMGNGRPENLRMDRLSVSGNRPDIQTIVPGGYPGGGLPPPSPLLEAYHGTYQSISPMPHAMMMDDDLDHLPPLDGPPSRYPEPPRSSHGRHRSHSNVHRSPSPPPRSSRQKDKLALEAYGGSRPGPEKEGRRVKIYDAEDDAKDLVEALAARTPDADTIIEILPSLSHDQMLELRSEYKRHCKVQGRGINIAKHIKLKTTGNFGKIAYVTALGKYEGEGYWANYWYQSNSAKRELLIEALMGRQNHEIREIKDAFRDKRYSDSLTRCMDKELKADKFRKAILMALGGERQEESDIWPQEYRNRDVDTLYKALRAKEGGETAMLGIVVMRSDAHLREVLRTYERKYQGNFARDALKRSNNLVGEVIAHILNGVINRPARDAMLLHHALMDLIEPTSSPRSSSTKQSTASTASTTSKHERQQRFELLISRLVRLHWDRLHLMRVKAEYEDKYGRVIEEDLEEATKGDFREFCIQLCQTGR
ncbi:Annexin [Plenodomus tracheiphilus IPT5]|uniref:Annexin n=1 Tax=Plenodomus tracheiphilus IPT5 TaxID=1408161 RepID=A0A6A7BM45_9PLEO|nr:Annexin [Plenodomus tracheiphilus IPT5]